MGELFSVAILKNYGFVLEYFLTSSQKNVSGNNSLIFSRIKVYLRTWNTLKKMLYFQSFFIFVQFFFKIADKEQEKVI